MSNLARLLSGTVVLAALISTPSYASISLLQNGPLQLTLGGFVELDTIFDNTRSFNEVMGSNPVLRPGTVNGSNGRMDMSVRNSRFYLQVDHHEAGGMKTRGYMEFDFLGFDPAPGTAGNTEASFFTNPTLRLRQAYFELTDDGWDGLAGQYWQLFGWQPYYFLTTADILPIPAMVFGRTPQLRLSRVMGISDGARLHAAFALNRPVERDSGLPDLQAGLRIAYDGWQASSTGSSIGILSPQPLSLGVSGLVREITAPSTTGVVSDQTHYPANALSVNTFIPILPSSEEDQSFSLSLIGSFTTGRGYGDQFPGWTGNTANPLTSPVLDGGIGDYDAQGTFHLIQLTSYNFSLQYTLPFATPTWIDGGHTFMTSNNMYLLTNASGFASNGGVPYTKEESTYFNLFRDVTSHIRLAFEFARVQTNYADNTIAQNNRYQISSWFLF